MIFNLEVIKNKTFLPFQSFANFVKKKKKYSKTLQESDNYRIFAELSKSWVLE